MNYILGSVFSVTIILSLETKKTATEMRIKHHRVKLEHHRVKLEFGLNFLFFLNTFFFKHGLYFLILTNLEGKEKIRKWDTKRERICENRLSFRESHRFSGKSPHH